MINQQKGDMQILLGIGIVFGVIGVGALITGIAIGRYRVWQADRALAARINDFSDDEEQELGI